MLLLVVWWADGLGGLVWFCWLKQTSSAGSRRVDVIFWCCAKTEIVLRIGMNNNTHWCESNSSEVAVRASRCQPMRKPWDDVFKKNVIQIWWRTRARLSEDVHWSTNGTFVNETVRYPHLLGFNLLSLPDSVNRPRVLLLCLCAAYYMWRSRADLECPVVISIMDLFRLVRRDYYQDWNLFKIRITWINSQRTTGHSRSARSPHVISRTQTQQKHSWPVYIVWQW